ncbi:proline-rich receptor-like protein kinase PERK9 [Delphinapterus leucas]|uniref:Proline-rich receptor-like protein kinase PERK9 n=1 Tax=Delphinapterus leucas TaxID=9749 RepID=A0A7F8KC91_DELLE|nr:proline-rich receptor-like protein kinase PERK9 [Delphinapterus leucas]
MPEGTGPVPGIFVNLVVEPKPEVTFQSPQSMLNYYPCIEQFRYLPFIHSSPDKTTLPPPPPPPPPPRRLPKLAVVPRFRSRPPPTLSQPISSGAPPPPPALSRAARSDPRPVPEGRTGVPLGRRRCGGRGPAAAGGEAEVPAAPRPQPTSVPSLPLRLSGNPAASSGRAGTLQSPRRPLFPRPSPTAPLPSPGFFVPPRTGRLDFSARPSRAAPRAVRPRIRARGPAHPWARPTIPEPARRQTQHPFSPKRRGREPGVPPRTLGAWPGPPWERKSPSEGEGRPEDLFCLPPAPLFCFVFLWVFSFFFLFCFFFGCGFSSGVTPFSEPTSRCGPLFIYFWSHEAALSSRREGGGVQEAASGGRGRRLAPALGARVRSEAESARAPAVSRARGSPSVMWTQLGRFGVRCVRWRVSNSAGKNVLRWKRNQVDFHGGIFKSIFLERQCHATVQSISH